ncbi:MAG: Fe(2+) transporter permease subunit FeoB [Neisseriaceae bacterium]
MSDFTISLIGNPNSGKTTLFNSLTGAHQQVGNWPGVTTERKTGKYRFGDKEYLIVDLPGTYAIEKNIQGIAQDELITRQFVLTDQNSLLINIVDAANLARNLFLTFQLLELGRPLIVVLNMFDIAKAQGLKIDVAGLQRAIGYPLVVTSATKDQGIEELKETIARYFEAGRHLCPHLDTLPGPIRSILQKFLLAIPEKSSLATLPDLLLLEAVTEDIADTSYSEEEKKQLSVCQTHLTEYSGTEADITIAAGRYEVIDKLRQQVTQLSGLAPSKWSERLDKLALGKFSGIVCFLAIMFMLFQFSINIGSSFNDFFDITFGAIFVDGTRALLEHLYAPNWLTTLLADGIGVGIKTTASFIPVLFFMFLFLSFLEDTGYLARAAMLVDRIMRYIGLPGKAFVPMIVGFGCNIPAIMGTRTLESEEDRLLSISMIPFMSCGARLPVYALLVATFFPKQGGLIVYALYLWGLVIAIMTGLVIKRTLLSPQLSSFVMELPPYHLPTLKGLLLATWQRLRAFIIQAGRAILIVVTLLGLLNSLGKDGTFGHSNSEESLLTVSAKALTPVFEPMGLTQDNWPATVGIMTGLLAKEVVIGTLNSLYAQNLSEQDVQQEAIPPFNLVAALKEAVDTTLDNLSQLPEHLLDPLGIRSELAGGDLKSLQEAQEVSDQSIQKIQHSFPNQAAVVAYLLFILLYVPCVAALGAIYRESSLRWTIFVTLWTLSIAWICATTYYQFNLLGTPQAPHAQLYLIGLPILLFCSYLFLKFFGKQLFIVNTHKE